jgi:hypothetical protein
MSPRTLRRSVMRHDSAILHDLSRVGFAGLRFAVVLLLAAAALQAALLAWIGAATLVASLALWLAFLPTDAEPARLPACPPARRRRHAEPLTMPR